MPGSSIGGTSPCSSRPMKAAPIIAPLRLGCSSRSPPTTRRRTSGRSSRRSASRRRTRRSSIIDDNSPDGTGRGRRRAPREPAQHPRHPPVGQARAGHGGARRDEVRHRQRLRLLPQPRRRLQPPAPVHPRHPRRDGRQRRDDRLALRPRRRGRGGFQPQAEVHEHRDQRLRPALPGLRTRDNSGSYRCYRVSKLRQIDLDRVRSRGYSFMEEILYWCRSVGCKFGETPILFENRRSGYSKISARGGRSRPSRSSSSWASTGSSRARRGSRAPEAPGPDPTGAAKRPPGRSTGAGGRGSGEDSPAMRPARTDGRTDRSGDQAWSNSRTVT